MQGSSALLVAGTVVLAAGLAGPTLAADETEPASPPAAVSEAEAEPAAPLVPAEPTPVAPAAGADTDADAGRTHPELETEAIEPTEPEGIGDPRGDRASKRQGDQSDGAEKQPLADVAVTIKDFEYRPDPVEVDVGDEVTWTNRDTAQHTATAEGKGDFDTGLLEKGQRGTVPFNAEGTFAYICTVHPDMKGEVVVRGSGSAGGSGGSSDSGGTSSNTTTDPTTPSSSSSDFGGSSSSTGGGSLPNTGQSELPLLLLGTGLIVIGLLARAFREHWIWR